MSLKDEARTVGDVERHLQSSLNAAMREREDWHKTALMHRDYALRLQEAIREFVEADAEMERHMADASIEDLSTRTPVFDRYDAAVAALKEAVK